MKILSRLLLVLGFLCLAWLCALANQGEGLPPDQALQKLQQGNARFVSALLTHPDLDPQRRLEVAKGQHPFAAILCCSDSRVPPELIFDQGLGDLFVVRVAGNVVNPDNLGSLEYAVEHLHTRLIVVLGHQRCGAVEAALEGKEVPGNLGALLARLGPAVEKARGEDGDRLASAILWNIRLTTQAIRTSEPVLAEEVRTGEVVVRGAQYNLDDGRVEFLK